MEKVLVLVDMKKCIVWKFLLSSSYEIISKEFFVMIFYRKKKYCENSTNRLFEFYSSKLREKAFFCTSKSQEK